VNKALFRNIKNSRKSVSSDAKSMDLIPNTREHPKYLHEIKLRKRRYEENLGHYNIRSKAGWPNIEKKHQGKMVEIEITTIKEFIRYVFKI
jgi:hypothetical protein